MRRFSAAIMLAFSAVLVFFSLFGDKIYHLVTPDVTTYTVSAAVILNDGTMKLTLPRECVKDGKVLLLEPSQAFERTVYTAKSVDINLSESVFYSDIYLIEKGLRQGDMVVLSCDIKLDEGQRVEIAQA